MIDKTELTESERTELKILALTKKKKNLEKEIEDLKYESMGIKNGKKSINAMANYFQD